MRSAANAIAPAAPSVRTSAAPSASGSRHPFQGSDYTRRVKGVAGLLVGLGAAALVLGTDLLSGAAAAGSGLHPLRDDRAQDLRLAADAHRAAGNGAQGHRARRDRRVLAAQPAAVRRPLAVAARRARDAARLPGARPGEGHRLRRQFRRGRYAARASIIGDDVCRARSRIRRWSRRSGRPATSSCSPMRPTTPTSGESRRRCPTRASRSTAPGVIERRVVFPPFAALARRRPRARATTCSCSIPTARSGTPCRSCGPAVACLPSLGVAAALRAAGIAPARCPLRRRRGW